MTHAHKTRTHRCACIWRHLRRSLPGRLGKPGRL